jgi:uncharacterized protein YdaU (DUF1376 family)
VRGEKFDTWMPFYVGDYLAATTRLTTEQHGAYVLLLLDYWRNGPPPHDDLVLAQIVRLSLAAWRKMKPAIMPFFEIRGEELFQGRVERERQKAAEITEKRSKAGKASAAARSRGYAPSTPDASLEETPVGTSDGTNGLQNGRPPQLPSVSGETGAKPPDPIKQMFDLGIDVLTATGITEKQARSYVGKLRKDHDDGDVLSALTECRVRSISNPVEWLPKRLGRPKGGRHFEEVVLEDYGHVEDAIEGRGAERSCPNRVRERSNRVQRLAKGEKGRTPP